MTKLTVPEWLPDWRDEKAYTYLNDVSPTQWAWEFVRRNPKYQNDYANYAAAVAEPRALPEESFFQYIERAKREGRWKIPPPKEADERSARYHIEPRPYDPTIKDARVQFAHPPWVDLGHGEHIEGQVKIVFDLRGPLKRQLQNAKRILDAWKAVAELSEDEEDSTSPSSLSRNTRFHFRRFPHYLRLLDAHQADVKLTDIAPVLLPDKPNEYPGYSATKLLRANLRTAKKQRDHGYIYLASMPDLKK